MASKTRPPPASADLGAAASSTPSSSKTPVRTPTLSETPFVGWAGSDPTVALREYDGAGEWEIPLDVDSVEIGGSSKCHIAIPGRGLSARHCMLERRLNGFRLHDLDSTNGTFVRGRRIDGAMDIRPGDTFTPMPVTLVAMNEEMRKFRPVLVEIIGVDFKPSPDRVMIEAASGSGHLLITGDPTCDQERLAEAIHAMSLRRKQQMIRIGAIPNERTAQAAFVKAASRAKATVLLSLAASGPRPDLDFVAMLFEPSFGVRAIVLARTPEVARSVLREELIGQMVHVQLRPLAYRSDEINQLMDGMLAERGCAKRTSDLPSTSQEALRAFDWPENLAQLRRTADEIAAVASHGSLNKAAKALGVPPSTLSGRFRRIGLEVKKDGTLFL